MTDRNRVVIATLVSPLIVFIPFEIWALVLNQVYGMQHALFAPPDEPSSIFLSMTYFASVTSLAIYPALLAVGLPSYFVLRKYRRASVWNSALVGFVTGFLLTSVFSLWSAIERLHEGPVFSLRDFWIDGSLIDLEFGSIAGFIGLIVGITFWLIAELPAKRAPHP